MTSATKCDATTKAGQPCRMPALAGTARCFAHSTDHATAATRDAARAAGGDARARQFARGAHAADLASHPPEWLRLATAADACNALSYVVREVLLGKLPARDANAATHALAALIPALHDAELERRLAYVESAVGVRRSR